MKIVFSNEFALVFSFSSELNFLEGHTLSYVLSQKIKQPHLNPSWAQLIPKKLYLKIQAIC